MKKTIVMILVLCLALSALTVTACADDGYQVKVVDPDGQPVEGVSVQFCSDTQCLLGKTDAEGIAAFDQPAGSYTIHLLKVPAGYEKDSTEYPAPETPDLVSLIVYPEGTKPQSVAEAGSGDKAGKAEDVLYAPVLGLHFVQPEGLKDMKGRFGWDAEFAADGLLNIPVMYYAVSDEDWSAYMNFYKEYANAYYNGTELPEAPDPSWMSGYESALLYDLYTIDGGRGEAELREQLLELYSVEPEFISNVTEIGSDGDCRFFLVQYAGNVEDMDDFKDVMNEKYFVEFESLVKDPSVFLSGLTLKAPQWPDYLSTGEMVSFKTADLDGNPVDSAELFAEAKITVINLWATWCGPCKGELPELAEMAKDFEAQGCRLVGLCDDASDDEIAAQAKAILADAGAQYLNLRSTDETAKIFQTDGVPTTYFFDSEGKLLVDPYVGANPDAYREILSECLSKLG